MTPRILLTACLLLSATAQAQDNCLEQNWQVFIDDAPIRMTFGAWLGADKQLAGRFLLNQHLDDNFLLPDPAGGWQAVNPDGVTLGHISLECGDDETLTGTWRTGDGRLTFPLKAEHSLGYYSLNASLIKNIAKGRKGGQPYDQVGVAVMPEARSIRLYGKAPAIVAINDAQHQAMLNYAEMALNCRAYAWLRDRTQQFAIPLYEDQLLLLTSDLAVIARHHPHACEEDYRFDDARTDILNLQTGAKVEILRWLSDPDAVIASQYEVQTEKASYAGTLSQLIWQAYRHPNPDCAAQVTFTLEQGLIYPAAQGLTFLPRARSGAKECIVPTTVPYRQLQPVLSVAGKQQVKAILAAPAD
jgi:hypothetical protein